MEGPIQSHPALKTSVESFRSAMSHNDDLAKPGSSKLATSARPEEQSSPLKSSQQQQFGGQHHKIPGLQLYAVDDFLQRNQHLLSPSSNVTIQPTATTISAAQVGATKSPQNVSRLNDLCQAKGIRPEYKYVALEMTAGGVSRFSGTLTLGTHVIQLPRPELSKKDVKQVLAELGLPVAESMPALHHSVTGPASENWIGKLNEFYDTLRGGTMPPQYTLFTPTPTSFAYEVSLPAHASMPFGSRSEAWSSKKAAKTAAARAAVDYLISLGLIAGSDGKHVALARSGSAFDDLPDNASTSTTTPHAPSIVAPISASGQLSNTSASTASTNPVQQAEQLAQQLGFCAPIYRFTSDDGLASNLWSGGAWFDDEPLLEGVVGEVRHVVGKKHAKAECAREVCLKLETIKKARAERLKGGETRRVGKSS